MTKLSTHGARMGSMARSRQLAPRAWCAHFRQNVIAIIFTLFCLGRPAAFGQSITYGKIGDNGSIIVPIANSALSYSADYGTVLVSAPPGLDLITLPSSQLGLTSISPGATAQFTLNYQVGPNSSEGSYLLQIYPSHASPLTYLDPPGSSLRTSVNIVIDNTPPSITLSAGGAPFAVATATPVVTVAAADNFGIQYIKLEGVSYSSTNYVSGVQTSAQNTFPDSGVLADGSYTATVVDLAGNVQTQNLFIDTANPNGTNLNPTGGVYSSSTVNGLVSTATAPSGIASIIVTCSGFSSTTTFSCSSPAKVGPYDFALAGTCTITRTNCAGKSTNETVNVSTGLPTITVKGVGSSETHSTSFSASTGALTNGISTITVTAGQFGAGIPAGYA